MFRNYLMGLAMVTMLSSGCMAKALIDTTVGDGNTETNESVIGMSTKVNATANTNANAEVNAEAEVNATGVNMSKTETIEGGQMNIQEGVDMETLMYIIGGFFTLMTGLITKMFIQLAAKDQIILDLGNDGKEILLKIMPMFILMHDKESYSAFMTLKAEYEAAVDIKVKQALAKKKGWFGRKAKEV